MNDPRSTRWLTRADGLATRLRAARGSRSQAELASVLGWKAPSKITRIEQGVQVPKPADVIRWAEGTGLSDSERDELLELLDEFHLLKSSFRERLKSNKADGNVQGDYNDLTAGASLIRHFQTTWIPGILQTEDYARSTLERLADIYPDIDVEAAITTRLKRRELLYEGGRAFEFVLTEPVLRWLFVPAQVMRSQLHRLLDVLDMPRVKVGIIPLGQPIDIAPQSSFVLYDDVMAAEHFGGEVNATGAEELIYEEVMGRLWRNAVRGSEARELIRDALADLPD